MDATKANFSGLLDAIYDAIEGLSVAGYTGISSDGWQRMRAPMDGEPYEHLGFWIDLGSSVEFSRPKVTYGGSTLTVCVRRTPEDDADSTSIAHAAALACMEKLNRLSIGTYGAAILVQGYERQQVDSDWDRLVISFDLYLARS